jgi:pyruvate,water dikinase
MWMWDEAHNPRPMGPLDFALRMRPMIEGSNKALELYGLPFQSEPKLIHGFVYQKLVLPDIAVEQFASIMKVTDTAIQRVAAELEGRWENTWLPEVQGRVAELEAFDLRGASLPGLLRHLAEVKRQVEQLWELHFQLASPMLVAISDFEEAYRDLFPDGKPFDAYELLAGFPNKTVEGNTRLWELGRAAANTPALRAILLESKPAALPAALAQRPEGQALWSDLQAFLRTYGERNDDLYLDAPTWIDDPTPVLRSLREAVLQPERDLGEELQLQVRRRESKLAEVRAQLASHPRPVVEEFEALLKAAQFATVLSEDHHFWIDCKITFHARRVSLEIGKRLAERGVLDRPGDVFELTLEELLALEDPGAATSQLRTRLAERRTDAAAFAGVTPPRFLGVPRPFPAMDSAFMRASFKRAGNFMGPPGVPGELRGLPGSRGKVTGPARIVRTLEEATKLTRGDILVAPTTQPSWTPFFAIAAAVVTGVGGILSHAAVVAREYGIPAVLGVSGVLEALHDGQLVEVDGDAGVVRIVAS